MECNSAAESRSGAEIFLRYFQKVDARLKHSQSLCVLFIDQNWTSWHVLGTSELLHRMVITAVLASADDNKR